MPMSTSIQNPLQQLGKLGQSVWLDYIRRQLLTSGELARLVREDGLRGVTSNPAIFEKAITGSEDYTATLAAAHAAGATPKSIYERLAVRDIQDAADILRPVYDASGKRDGYVSLEVSPYLARDTDGTIAEAVRLWDAIGRPNAMIKVPATPEGIPAIEALIARGINVNVTLLFARAAYAAVAEAYLRGLEQRRAAGGDLSHVASVASFFVSRIDAAVDARVGDRLRALSPDAPEARTLTAVAGRVAIANAKSAYRHYQRVIATLRWRALAEAGAQPQRLLWASTGTKNPAYSEVLYVEELIGPDTVNTIPPATYEAFRERGTVRASLTEGVDEAEQLLDHLHQMGISLDAVTSTLLEEGLTLFAAAFDRLLASVDQRCEIRDLAGLAGKQSCALPGPLGPAVHTALEDWAAGGKTRRLWERDATLWTGGNEGRWLGWLGVAEDAGGALQYLAPIVADARSGRFDHILLMGMGGSSLCPEVLARVIGSAPGFPTLVVLDSTDPDQIAAIEAGLDLSRTLFIVSSKSGSTLEPNIFKEYFFAKVVDRLGRADAARRFVAITDPGSALQRVAEGDRFRHIAFGVPSIGGRYSALSNFGLVPAAVMGLDVAQFLERTATMVHACTPCVAVTENPGVSLGVALGVLHQLGRNKLTILASPRLEPVGAWLEQLVAESTGKNGKGIIPVDREPLGDPGRYGADRVFVLLRWTGDVTPDADAGLAALEAAGHPVVRITIADLLDLGQEFFRWEIATAVAGAVIGINPFDQPDVEASKIATRDLTAAYERTGALPADAPLARDGALAIYTDDRNRAALVRQGVPAVLGDLVRAHWDRLGPGDYAALLAYLPMTAAHDAVLQRIRRRLRDHYRVATCLGYGPRFLHSTGQAYKGGPNTGVFLQVTGGPARDLPIPGKRYTFGVVKTAQALGDFQVLADRDRRAIRIDLGPDVTQGLAALERVIDAALDP